jgi:hypothetical protein
MAFMLLGLLVNGLEGTEAFHHSGARTGLLNPVLLGI